MRRLLVCLVAFALSACASGGHGATSGHGAVASFFPIAATLRALDPRLPVVDLTPPGVEPHDLELTTPEMDRILDASLVVVMGKGFQPAIERAARDRTAGALVVLDHLDVGSDPHVWLDPVLMQRVVRLLATGLIRTEPAARDRVEQRAAELDARLIALDRAYRAGLARCDRRIVVTAHAAFGRLASRYGLRQEPIAGISPEQEPDPRRMAELTDLVRRYGVTTVFTERLVSPRVAQTLAREAGVKTAVLDPIESPRDQTSFSGYLAAMSRNLGALRRALGCA